MGGRRCRDELGQTGQRGLDLAPGVARGGLLHLPQDLALRLRLGDGRAARDVGELARPLPDRDHQRQVPLDDLHEVGALERRGLHQRGQQAEQLQPGVEHRLDAAHADALVVEQPGHAVERLLVELDRREHEVGGDECRDDADVRVGVGVDDAGVELPVHRR